MLLYRIVYATIVVSSRQKGIGNGLTYRAGSGMGLWLGALVRAPLRGRLVEGVVVDVSGGEPEGAFEVKEIVEVVSNQPLLTPGQIATAKWMAEYYLCTVRQALSVFLPGLPWSRLLSESGSVSRRINSPANALTNVVVDNEDLIRTTINLTPRQTAACKAIKADPRPTLLFGVTGSGKTEIYAALIRDAIRSGKSAILLLPEILLTENFLGRFQQLVDRSAIAVVHSRLTLAQRRDSWRRCHSGQARLVIGSRSALFSPVQNPGLIIVDEEHEWTYKNERAPRYHAGKVAEMICGGITNHQFPKLVLGTATPSVDTWYRAKNGQYQLAELPERYGGAALPTVRIVDLAQVRFGRHYPLSPTLVNAIRERLARHEQVVLFLNRRGFATSLLCLDCRYRFEDPATGLPYTVHCSSKTSYLLSHHTGERLEIPMQCPKCGGTKLREVGAGTERVESLLREFFPSARLLRADSDMLKSPQQMRMLLKRMKEGGADILLGTQSVVKGLDLPNVTLAAVLLADVGLSLPHFRAGERVFQLLTQLIGRSGRSQPGEVIIQTFRPSAMEVALSARCDVRAYLERELAERRRAHYPPDTELVRFVFSGPGAGERSKRFAQALDEKRRSKDRTLQYTSILISRSPSVFSGGKVWQVLVRGRGVREMLKEMPEFDGIVDVDPVECL